MVVVLRFHVSLGEGKPWNFKNLRLEVRDLLRTS